MTDDDVEYAGTVHGRDLIGVDDETGEFVFAEAEIFADRAPVAAVTAYQHVHVVCSDGACYKLGIDNVWRELEPVPGTERVGTLAAELDALPESEEDG